jgi:hypothetical protein
VTWVMYCLSKCWLATVCTRAVPLWEGMVKLGCICSVAARAMRYGMSSTVRKMNTHRPWMAGSAWPCWMWMGWVGKQRRNGVTLLWRGMMPRP